MKTVSDIHVVLQAGGEGRRIQGVDENAPKPMLTVGGIPLIERLLVQLASAGFRRFTVVTGFRGSQIREHVESVSNSLPYNIKIRFHQETSALGNAGAITQISKTLSTVLLVFADLYTDIDFARLIQVHSDRQNAVTLTSHYEEHRLVLGELATDGEVVTKYVEKPTKKYLICSGIAALNQDVLLAAADLPLPFGLSDLIQLAIDRSFQVGHWTHGAMWLDVNTPEALQEARALADRDHVQESR